MMEFTLRFEDLKKEDFVNPEVLGAMNPHPTMGYAYGPIPNNNPGWRADHNDIHTKPGKKELICAITAGKGPPRPMVLMNPTNTLVCDILVGDEGTHMCGSSFRRPGGLAIHLRLSHFGAVNEVEVPYYSDAETRAAAVNAIKRHVLTGGWRRALYSKEPGRAQPESVLGVFCDALENIARNDAAFAAEYGTKFHRSTTNSLHKKMLKYLGVPSNLEDGESPQTTPRSRRGRPRRIRQLPEPEPEPDSASASEYEVEVEPESGPIKPISNDKPRDQQHSAPFTPTSMIDLVATDEVEFVSARVLKVKRNVVERAIKIEPNIGVGHGVTADPDVTAKHVKAEPDTVSELIIKVEKSVVIDLVSDDESAMVVDLEAGDESELEDASWPVEVATDVFPLSLPGGPDSVVP